MYHAINEESLKSLKILLASKYLELAIDVNRVIENPDSKDALYSLFGKCSCIIRTSEDLHNAYMQSLHPLDKDRL